MSLETESTKQNGAGADAGVGLVAHDEQMADKVDGFLDANPLRTLLKIPPAVIVECRQFAYRLYTEKRYADCEQMARGLVAADGGDIWAHRLLAASLQKQFNYKSAVAVLDVALARFPDDQKLLAMKVEVVASASRANAALRAMVKSREEALAQLHAQNAVKTGAAEIEAGMKSGVKTEVV